MLSGANSNMLHRLLANSLFKDATKLISGAVGGRLILLLALPVLTRLYNPEDFRLLAVFIALVSTMSVVACLRLEIAIPLAENHDDAANLLALALLFAATISIMMLVLTCFASERIAFWLNVPDIDSYLWLVPLGLFLAASYSTLEFWATRMHRFGVIGRTRVWQAATGTATMLALGWAALAPLGLLLGNMLTLGAGGLALALQIMRNDRAPLLAINRLRMHKTLIRYRRYPTITTFESLASVAGLQIPILIIAANAGSEAGQLFLALQVIAAPILLLGGSIGQVYVSRASVELKKGRLHEFTRSILSRMLIIGIGPMLIAATLSPFLFEFLFGPSWQRAGWIVSWMAPWMIAQLIAAPLAFTLRATENHMTALGLQALGAALRIGAVIVALSICDKYTTEIFALSSFIFYVIYSLCALNVTRGR